MGEEGKKGSVREAGEGGGEPVMQGGTGSVVAEALGGRPARTEGPSSWGGAKGW